MAQYHVTPALYIWSGTEWVLSLPIWQDNDLMKIRQMYYSANGTTWVR